MDRRTVLTVCGTTLWPAARAATSLPDRHRNRHRPRHPRRRRHRRRHRLPIPPDELSTGTYTAAVTVEDRIADTDAVSATTEVAVVEPLQKGDLPVAFEGHEKLDGLENVAVEWTVSNTSDRDRSFVSGLSVKRGTAPASRYPEVDGTVVFDIPAGVTQTYRLEEWNPAPFEQGGWLEFRFDAYDFEWRVPVE